jgi:hypothetical protein
MDASGSRRARKDPTGQKEQIAWKCRTEKQGDTLTVDNRVV